MNKRLKAADHHLGESILPDLAIGNSMRIEIPTDRLDARKTLRSGCPTVPGVYAWLDAAGQIGYVGKSKSLKKRLLSYFSKTVPDEKMHRIRRHSRTIIWQPISHELLALLREQELINQWRPPFNSQGQPTRRKPAFVSITSSAAPNAVVQRKLSQTATHRFGPILGTAQLRESIDNLNNVFKLRDCPDKTTMEFSDQLELFARGQTAKCIRHELNTCPGPCAGACSRDRYLSAVNQAVDFLSGFDRSVLENLEARMNQAAEQRQFETAAVFRDRLESLAWLDRRLETLRRAKSDLNCVYQVPGTNGKPVWLILDSGLPVACAAAPTDPQSAIPLDRELKLVASRKHRFPDGPLETNFQLIVISWFRHQKQERKNLVSVRKARRVCREIFEEDSFDSKAQYRTAS